jgi:hypothetical protein
METLRGALAMLPRKIQYVTILRGRWCNIVILNVHAPCEDTSDDVKNRFCEELARVFNEFPRYNMKILLCDFNAKEGRQDIFKPTIGNESSHEMSNDNGVRVYVKWVHCHHGMARFRVADRGDGLQIWRVAANIFNNQTRTADCGWYSSRGVGRGLTTLPHKNQYLLRITTHSLETGRITWHKLSTGKWT